MTSPTDAYVQRVARGLAGMDRRVRADVLRELRSHLADAGAETDEARAVSAAEPPAEVAARYKRMYGYGRAFQTAFVALAIALAIPTLPLLLYGDVLPRLANAAAVAFLVLLVAYLMGVALAAGWKVGLVAGMAACASRFGTLAALGAVAGAVVPDASGWLLFTASSLLLIVIGFVPGAAKERWQRRDVGM